MGIWRVVKSKKCWGDSWKKEAIGDTSLVLCLALDLSVLTFSLLLVCQDVSSLFHVLPPPWSSLFWPYPGFHEVVSVLAVCNTFWLGYNVYACVDVKQVSFPFCRCLPTPPFPTSPPPHPISMLPLCGEQCNILGFFIQWKRSSSLPRILEFMRFSFDLFLKVVIWPGGGGTLL